MAWQRAPIAMAVIDRDFRFRAVNDAWCALLARNADACLALTWLDTGSGTALAAELAELARLQRGEIPAFSRRRALSRGDGSAVPVEVSVNSLGELGAIVSMQPLQEQAPLAAGSVPGDELEPLAAAVSHDLRQEARMAASFAGLLERRGQTGPDEAGHLASIAEHAVRLHRRLGLLAQWLRVRIAPAGGRADVGRAWKRALEAHAQALGERGIVAEAGELPTLAVDEDRLAQVLGELVRSAFHAPRPRLRLDAEREGGAWHLRFSDGRPSLPEEQGERPFRIFAGARADDDAAALAFCRALANASGGRAWLTASQAGDRIVNLLLPAHG